MGEAIDVPTAYWAVSHEGPDSGFMIVLIGWHLAVDRVLIARNGRLHARPGPYGAGPIGTNETLD